MKMEFYKVGDDGFFLGNGIFIIISIEGIEMEILANNITGIFF